LHHHVNVLGLGFALLVCAAGLGGVRLLRLARWELAPPLGLALLVVPAIWFAAAGLPPWLAGLLGLSLAAVGLASYRLVRTDRWTLGLLLVATALPALLLGLAFAGLEVPVSNHDGAFHVENVDMLRRGVAVTTWYPLGFHATVAAVLALVPWVDSARGTLEVAQGLAILTPLCVFGLGRALGLRPLHAAAAAVVQAVTFLFPYDAHLWGGWPLATGILLTLGLWSVALAWLEQPAWRWALAFGLLAGAIVLTHGTEVYTSALGLLVMALLVLRGLRPRSLAAHTPVAVLMAVVACAPFIPTALHWANTGGATGAGIANLDVAAAHPDLQGRGDWLQFVLGITGAGTLVDLPLRGLLLVLGIRAGVNRFVLGLWLTFVTLLFVVDFLDLAPVNQLFVLTFPWLVDHRPRQVAVILASLIEAGGVLFCLNLLRAQRPRFAVRPVAWRRTWVGAALLIGFLVEGSGVTIYKRLAQDIDQQNVFSADDSVAMAWLRAHVQPGQMLVNDQAADAGIWAPYKANVPILLPRSGSGDQFGTRAAIAEHVDDLGALPNGEQQACRLGLSYLYQGARPTGYDERLLPTLTALERSDDLTPVFRSGEAVVFRIDLPCPPGGGTRPAAVP